MIETTKPETLGNIGDGRRWFVVETAPNREREAKFHLERQGFGVYLPMRVSSHARKIGASPLFPRYLFIRLNPEVERWRAVLSTVGVSTLLCAAGDRPYPVCDGEVAAIQAKEVEGVILLVKPRPRAADYRLGERVDIVAGPLAGVDALVAEHVDSKRVLLFLSIFGRESRVTTPVECLAAPAVR